MEQDRRERIFADDRRTLAEAQATDNTAHAAETRERTMGFMMRLPRPFRRRKTACRTWDFPTGVAERRIGVPGDVDFDVFDGYLRLGLITMFDGPSIGYDTSRRWLDVHVEDHHGMTDPILQHRLDWALGLAEPPAAYSEWDPLPVQAARYARDHPESTGFWDMHLDHHPSPEEKAMSKPFFGYEGGW